MVIAGLQAAFLLFHNRVVDRLRAGGTGDAIELYAAGATADHVALPVADPARVPAAVRRPGAGRRRPAPRPPVLPARARARRRSRSSSRAPPTASATRWSGPRTARTSPATAAAVLRLHLRPRPGRPGSDPGRPPRRLPRAPRRFVGWQTFFDFGDGQVKRNKRIDTKHLDAALPPAARRDRHPTRGRPCCPSARCSARSRGSFRPARRCAGASASRGLGAGRPRRAQGLRARARALDAALVLRAQGGRADRGRAAPRAGRRPHRRRGDRRPAPGRSGLVPRLRPALAADACPLEARATSG